jgi:hypothetical protein
VELGVFLPALAVDDEHLMPRLVPETADFDEQRLGDLSVVGEDPEAHVVALPLGPRRERDDDIVLLPPYVVDAVLDPA